MPKKIIDIAGVGPVEFNRRRGATSIRLSVSGGVARVSLPFWVPYATAVTFAAGKAAWLREHLEAGAPATLRAGQAIGKAHRLSFVPAATITSRITGNTIQIGYPSHLSSDDAAVQQKAYQAAVRALRKEAERLLPSRVATLADKHGYRYGTISVKQLKRRWGSCDQRGNLTFNLFLMELSWDLIDYVIMHELNHTVHMNHSAEFWNDLKVNVADLPAIRKRIRGHQPTIGA